MVLGSSSVGRLLLFLFTVVPLVELYLLMWLGRLMGFWPTVALVLGTGILGASLAKAEGLRVLGNWQRDMAEGRMPKDGAIDGLLIFVGGIFLITPGVLTDAFGLAMLIPPIRHLFARFVQARIERGIQAGHVRVQTFEGGRSMHWGGGARVDVDVVDVEGHEIPVERPELPKETDSDDTRA